MEEPSQQAVDPGATRTDNCFSIFFFLKAGPHEVKAGFELALRSRVTLNF